MRPAANDHSASYGNDENRLLKFNIPILPGDNYGLTTSKNSLRIIATLLNNKISQTISDCHFSNSFYRQANNRYASQLQPLCNLSPELSICAIEAVTKYPCPFYLKPQKIGNF